MFDVVKLILLLLVKKTGNIHQIIFLKRLVTQTSESHISYRNYSINTLAFSMAKI